MVSARVTGCRAASASTPAPERYSAERAPPKAEASIPGFGAIVAEAERGADAQGAPINRAMIRLRVPLGGEKR